MAVWHDLEYWECGFETMNLEVFNKMPAEEAESALLRCCGSQTWVSAMLARRPFLSTADVFALSDATFATFSTADWLEAFRHHPQIGDSESLRKRFAATADLAAGEQKAVEFASLAVLNELKCLNSLYEERFGFIFIVCATGKSAGEMLSLLKSRIDNPPDRELSIAGEEQSKITRIRLEKLLL